jgi:hypothetical protein
VVTWTRPSAEPAQRTLASRGETASDGNRQRRDVRKSFGTGLVVIDRSAARAFGRTVIAREIGTEDTPSLAAVQARENDLRRDEQFARIGRREEGRMRPAEAIFRLRRRGARHIARPRADVFRVSGDAVEANERAKVSAAVGYERIAGIGRDERALAQSDRVPLIRADARADRRADTLVRAFVLRGAENMKRKLVVELHVIELARRLIAIVAPVVTPVDRNRSAAIVSNQQNLWLVRIDPYDVIVAVGYVDVGERLAAVGRLVDAVDFGRVDDLRVGGIDGERHIIEGALAQLPLGVDALPRPARVVGPENSAIVRLYDGVNDPRVARRYRDADLP